VLLSTELFKDYRQHSLITVSSGEASKRFLNPVSLALCSRRFWIHLNFQPHPTEAANYTGSYTSVRKGIVDIEIAMYQSAGTVIIIIDTSTIAAKTIVTAATQMLLLLIAACTFLHRK
jgi:hypothetical protein